jgi:unconventional prefoldin RPB5 interactor 1
MFLLLLCIISLTFLDVHGNVTTLEKRLETEQEKLDKANYLGYRDEEGLPLTEITEELDEQGNVLSTSLSKPGDVAPQILDALRESGLAEGGDSGSTSGSNDKKAMQGSNSSTQQQLAETASNSKSEKRKSVSFAEVPEVKELPSKDDHRQRQTQLVEDDEEASDNESREPIIPENETPEEVAIRREMLEYSMNEVGAVVAEMDLYEDTDNEDYEDDEDEFDDEDEDYEEDEFGRITTRVISDDYRKEMLELERKLNARAMVNVGPETDTVSHDEDSATKESPEPKPEKFKGVRFAEELDIQDRALPKPTNPPAKPKSIASPMAQEIVERKVEQDPTTNVPAQKKPSRFKADRGATSQTLIQSTEKTKVTYANGPFAGNDLGARLTPKVPGNVSHSATDEASKTKHLPTPTGPIGKIFVDTLVERPECETVSDIKEPDELDPELLNSQITSEYHRMRNRMIQRDNGFMNQDMQQHEDETGRPKMSRFKAARLAKS